MNTVSPVTRFAAPIMSDETQGPELSIILPTDTWETIQPVVERLRRQTMARRLEVLLVHPPDADFSPAARVRDAFAAWRTLEVPSLSPLGAARAAGVRAASAPCIFIGETHSFLEPEAVAIMLAAVRSGPWTAVVPGFANANPGRAASWAGFLADYARWNADEPGREIADTPLYNALYRRDVLLALPGDLARLFSHGDELRIALQQKGARALFVPEARIAHLNISRPPHSLLESYLAGTQIGSQRASRWPAWRRLLYAGGAPLIPVVLGRRVLPTAWKFMRKHRINPLALPMVVALLTAKGAGEFVGLLGLSGRREGEMLDHYELRKVDFIK